MPDGTKFEVKALVKHPRRKVEIEVEEGDLVEAIRRDGFADGQNCAGAVCVCRPKHKKLFDHEVSALVDWWHSRVFLSAGRQRNGVAICYCYAHYDTVEALFDGGRSALQKLLGRIRKSGPIKVTLYPIKRGKNPRTGKTNRPSRTRGTSGEERKPRKGNELRLWNYLKAHQSAAKTAQGAAA